jgi:TonB-dependent starch-binding outer membrane protein SusC
MKIKVNFKSFMLLALFTVLSNFAFAQRTITGVVKDADSGETLVGSSVVVTGTTKGTLTDLDGKYELQVPADAASLTFSYTGYSNLTISIGALKVVDANLKGGSILEAVVVVGYGSVKKSDATGAVVALDEKSFNRGVLTSPEQLMQGRAAGVQISQNGGEPGGGISVRVRGTSSVNGGNNPLFVIDGVPLSTDNSTADGQSAGFGSSSSRNPLNYLNPNDIASIDILKDASSTAIYGARGANGVVLITTKKGKKGAGSFEYGYSLGVSQITKKYDLLSASAFAAASIPANNLGGSTNWQDVVLQTGLTNNHNLAYGGGSDKGSYRFSLGYMDQNGIFKQSGFQRYSARFNGDQKFIDDRLTVGVNITASNTIDAAVPITNDAGFGGDLLSRMLVSNPTLSIYKYNKSAKADCDTCEINQPSSNSEANPAAILRYTKDVTNTIRTTGDIHAEFKIIDGLTFKTVVGFDKSQSQRRSATSPLLNNDNNKSVGGRSFYSNVALNNSLFDMYLNYNNKFGDIDFSGLLGYSYQSNGFQNDRSELIGFPTDPAFLSNIDYQLNNAGAASKSIVKNSARYKDEIQSQFARVNFGYKEKYLVTASVRRDGSTKFGTDNQYGIFPSVGVKWRLIQEEFIPKNIFSDLGLRLGYGVTGNQDIPHNLFSQRTRYGDATFDNSKINPGGIIFPAGTTGNNKLQWESTKQLNFGLDFGFLNNRLTGTFDYYKKNTDKLLIKVKGDGSATGDGVWLNLPADVQNSGVELSLNFVAVDSKDFRWTISGNIANNTNIVNSLAGAYNTGNINGQGLSGAYAQQIIQGQPLGAYFIRKADGYDSKGLSKYADGNDAQLQLGKSGLPTLSGGLTNTFAYKGLDFSFFLNGVAGNYIYNNTTNAFFTQGALASGRNVTANVVGNGESKDNAPEPSTRFLEKGDFLRLSNLSLGYNLPISNGKIKGVRVFVVGQNLMTFTGYTGQDPEVNTNKSRDGIPSFGIDYTAYPVARTWSFGASVTF